MLSAQHTLTYMCTCTYILVCHNTVEGKLSFYDIHILYVRIKIAIENACTVFILWYDH